MQVRVLPSPLYIQGEVAQTERQSMFGSDLDYRSSFRIVSEGQVESRS